MIAEAELAPIAAALRRGRRDPTDLLADLRDRIEAVDPEIEALVDPPDWDGLAATAEARLEAAPPPAARPPLFGVPVGVKDIFHVDGHPTRAGSTLPPDALAGPEATAVERLRSAGALVLGKTHTTEFAYAHPGPTRNPHDPAHTPGGSSSGSAAGVAAGLFPLALGSQTVGSVIRPAAFCGVVGFKPSYGRIPTDGVIPLAASVDHVGLFAQDVPGARLAAGVLLDEWRSMPAPAGRPTLGVPDAAYLEQAEPAGLAAFERAIEALESRGFAVRRTDALATIAPVNDRHNALVAADAALAHHEWYGSYADRYAPATAELIEEGREVATATVAGARAGRTALRADLTETMRREGVDLWVAPAAPGPAPAGLESTGDPTMNLPWTHAGLPTVALPAGRVDGLPVGCQVAGPFDGDESLLAWAEPLADALASLEA